MLGAQVDSAILSKVVRQCCRNHANDYYDLFRIPHYSPQALNARTETLGIENLNRALEGGKGVLLGTAHIGSFDLVAQIALPRSLPLTVLVERLEPPDFWEQWLKLRTAQGLTFQPADGEGMRAVFRALRNGEIVGIACDRVIQGNGIWTLFMGKPALMPVGAAELALRTGAALIPAFFMRAGRDRYRVHLEAPVDVPHRKGRHTHEDVKYVVDQVIAVMERFIRAEPNQWVLFHPLWANASARPAELAIQPTGGDLADNDQPVNDTVTPPEGSSKA